MIAEKKFKWKNSTKILVWKNWKRIFHGNIVKRKKILPKVTFNLSQNNYQEIIFYSIKISIELSRLSKRLATTIVEIKKKKRKKRLTIQCLSSTSSIGKKLPKDGNIHLHPFSISTRRFSILWISTRRHTLYISYARNMDHGNFDAEGPLQD